MDDTITAGLAKQIVLTRALEVTANNIANQTTAGYKSEQMSFREYLANVAAQDSADPTVSLVYDPDSYTDFSAGGIDPTYNDLDFAIDGEGFFAVERGDGVAYTRDGRFTVDGFGELVTRKGERVLDDRGAPVLLDPERGAVVATPEGELQQDGVVIARLGVFGFDTPESLRKTGDNLFVTEDAAISVDFPRVRQGFVETSNVAPIAAVTDMIEIMRAYEQAARVVETADNLEREAIRTLSETA
jgi:flagellar basal-body rod protein FlgF